MHFFALTSVKRLAKRATRSSMEMANIFPLSALHDAINCAAKQQRLRIVRIAMPAPCRPAFICDDFAALRFIIFLCSSTDSVPACTLLHVRQCTAAQLREICSPLAYECRGVKRQFDVDQSLSTHESDPQSFANKNWLAAPRTPLKSKDLTPGEATLLTRSFPNRGSC